MATFNKDFRLKSGIVVEGSTATVNGNNVLTTASSIDALSDVVITSATNGQVLKYNGTNWINGTDSTGGGGGALDDLTDVVITSATSGQVLKYNGTNWINNTDSLGFIAQTSAPSDTNVLWLDTDENATPAISPTLIDAKGDLIVGTAADTVGILTAGTNEHRLVVDSAVTAGLKYVADTTNYAIAAKGDLLVGTAADTVTNLTVGTNNHILVADSAQASGLKWTNTIQASSSSTSALILQGTTSQSASIQQWQNVSGTTLATIDSTGRFNGIGATLEPTANDVTGLTVNIPSGSSANIATFSKSTGGGTTSINNNGTITTKNVQINVATGLATTGTVDLDFNTEGFKSHSGNLTGNITYTASNYAAGRSVTVRVPNGSTLRTLTFPSTWKFVGSKPANIAASKVGVLTVTSFETTEADCVAAWAVEA